MCIIVDNNVVARVLNGANDSDFCDLFRSLFGSRNPCVTLVFGGTLKREYMKNTNVVRALAALDRAGRARKVPDSIVDAEADAVDAGGRCVSDDPHIIALARVSGVRLLCSHDLALHTDFTNKDLLDPRGRVYQNTKHNHLLNQECTQT